MGLHIRHPKRPRLGCTRNITIDDDRRDEPVDAQDTGHDDRKHQLRHLPRIDQSSRPYPRTGLRRPICRPDRREDNGNRLPKDRPEGRPGWTARIVDRR